MKRNLKNSIGFKIGIIVVLILILLIPTTMVKDLIREREHIRRSAINEVGEKWGDAQTITGPFLSIPYDKYVKQFTQKDSVEKIVKIKEWIHFLPEDLSVKGSISPEKRTRGIYEVVVYNSEFTLEGKFAPINLKLFDVNPNHIHFDKAIVNVGITDLKGIEEQIHLQWNKTNTPFNSGVSHTDIVSSGINTSVSVTNNDSLNYQFQLTLNLKGNEHLYFRPVGKTTDVMLNSEWTTPSFQGTFLPDESNVDDNGFTAHWNVLHLNRNYPQAWLGNAYSVYKSLFGVDLLLPVDNYKKSNRIAKYTILFLVLTFLVFFFVEVLNGVFVHPIQYLLVGVALIVFYSLLLAFSEHMLFNLAYILATCLTLLLITFYATAILKSRNLGLMVFSILLIMYTFIFAIIQMQDYALLIGSIGVFIILAVVMYLSRKIDWYQVKLGGKENVGEIN